MLAADLWEGSPWSEEPLMISETYHFRHIASGTTPAQMAIGAGCMQTRMLTLRLNSRNSYGALLLHHAQKAWQVSCPASYVETAAV